MKNLKSINPFTQSEVGSYAAESDAKVDQKIEQAYRAFQDFRDTGFEQRSVLMKRVAELLQKKKDELARLITSEMGKKIGESISEIEKCAWVCENYASKASEFLSEEKRESDASDSYIIYQPLGPILAVMPWNFPFWQVFRFAAPALMAGNVALLKHASNVQGCAAAIEKLFHDAGFKDGIFTNLVIGSSKVERVIRNDYIKAVTLTGSESAGRAVASAAGSAIKKSVLELGGNNGFVVLNDADIDLAVDTAVTARMINCGQSCIAAKRFIIQQGIYDAFLSRLIQQVESLKPGDPMLSETGYGPLFSVVQADEINHQVKDAVDKGANLEMGGRQDQAFFTPTVLSGVTPKMKVFREETFGPVFAVIVAEDINHALALNNDSSFGLGMQLFTRSEKSAGYFIRNANEGAVFVNGLVKSDPRLPFGGVKRSGYGRELSVEGIREFVNLKTIWIR